MVERGYCIYSISLNIFNLLFTLKQLPSVVTLFRNTICRVVSGIASIFAVDYSSNFPTDDRPLIDFFTPL